jgi:hypothetical protein
MRRKKREGREGGREGGWRIRRTKAVQKQARERKKGKAVTITRNGRKRDQLNYKPKKKIGRSRQASAPKAR